MKKDSTPLPLRRAFKKLGGDISFARRRRRISVEVMSKRASISRATLSRIEKGDSGVSMRSYAAVLFVLGLTERLAQLADPGIDVVGREIEEENLPKRIRASAKG